MDDLRIIELYFNRDEQAIKETDTKYGKLCHSIAYNILNNHEDSEEYDDVTDSEIKSLLEEDLNEFNKATFQVSIGGKILPKITRQEFAILELLLRNPKQVFSKEDIFEYAWDEPYMGETKTLDVHISNIRKKIKTVTSEEYIETVWGIGYRLHL